MFSRFAVGFHLVDAAEGAPRNPFRAAAPTRERFAGYEENLATLAALHPGDPGIVRFVEQAHADIEETCGRPDTIGVEFGGACSLECAFHRRLHRCQPGGVDTHDLLDRLAYATKVGARGLYLLGGEPAEHPGFLALLHAARARRDPPDQQPRRPRCPSPGRASPPPPGGPGSTTAVIEVLAFDGAAFDVITRSTGQFPRFLAGIERLGEAGIRRSARLVVAPGHEGRVPETLAELRARGLALDEVMVLESNQRALVERNVREAGFTAMLLPPPGS